VSKKNDDFFQKWWNSTDKISINQKNMSIQPANEFDNQLGIQPDEMKSVPKYLSILGGQRLLFGGQTMAKLYKGDVC